MYKLLLFVFTAFLIGCSSSGSSSSSGGVSSSSGVEVSSSEAAALSALADELSYGTGYENTGPANSTGTFSLKTKKVTLKSGQTVDVVSIPVWTK